MKFAYYMIPLDTFVMTSNLETFSKGARALRKAQDWAKEQKQKVGSCCKHKEKGIIICCGLIYL